MEANKHNGLRTIGKLLLLAVIAAPPAAAGYFAGGYMEKLQAVKENAAYHHPKTGKILYGNSESKILMRELCKMTPVNGTDRRGKCDEE